MHIYFHLHFQVMNKQSIELEHCNHYQNNKENLTLWLYNIPTKLFDSVILSIIDIAQHK